MSIPSAIKSSTEQDIFSLSKTDDRQKIYYKLSLVTKKSRMEWPKRNEKSLVQPVARFNNITMHTFIAMCRKRQVPFNIRTLKKEFFIFTHFHCSSSLIFCTNQLGDHHLY